MLTKTLLTIYRILFITILSLSLTANAENLAELKAKFDNLKITTDELVKIQEICYSNDGPACFALGTMYQYSNYQDLSKAASFYQKGCDLDEGIACSSLGSMYQEGKGVAQDLSKAASFYQKGCDLDEGIACSSLGSMYQEGKGVAQDLSKAESLYQKGCDLDYGFACAGLGTMYSNLGTTHQLSGYLGFDVAQNYSKAKSHYSKAKSLFQKGCNLDESTCIILELFYQQECNLENDGDSCFYLSKMYLNGQGIDKDFNKAAIFLRKSCDLNFVTGCKAIASKYMEGDGVSKNEAIAAVFLKKSCDLGDSESCWLLAELQ